MSSHDKLRHDTECQNCGHTVEEIFCPHCGQKNIETRQSFHHLAGHVIEDITHYDSGFWRTIKYLLFRPARLTQEYLAGKRQAYVPPVKLYIFISFIAFFLPGIIPDFTTQESQATVAREERLAKQAEHAEKTEKSIDLGTISIGTIDDNPKEISQTSHFANPNINVKENVYIGTFGIGTKGPYMGNPLHYRSIKEMDSIEAIKPDYLRLSKFEYKIAKKLIHLYHKNTQEEVGTMVANAFPHNLSKAIFFYMPIFAVWLWLFHGKKRWYFFDHCIFTLHYFSFLLLTSTLLILFYKLTVFTNVNSIVHLLFGISIIFVILWQIFYFYRSHRKMYNEKLMVNFLKSTAMFFINFASILFVLFLFLIYTYHNLH